MKDSMYSHGFIENDVTATVLGEISDLYEKP